MAEARSLRVIQLRERRNAVAREIAYHLAIEDILTAEQFQEDLAQYRSLSEQLSEARFAEIAAAETL